MEWLGDFATEIADADPEFTTTSGTATPVAGRLFVAFTSRSAYAAVLQLWRAWTREGNDGLTKGYKSFAGVFAHLHDVRAWSWQDRIAATGIVGYWNHAIASGATEVRFESELWCRQSATERDRALDRIRRTIGEGNGQVLSSASIPEISYHGALLSLPAKSVRATIRAVNGGQDTRLLRLTEVKYFNPPGQAAYLAPAEGEVAARTAGRLPTRPPVAALLDGLPLLNHEALKGRIVVDDPDGFQGLYGSTEARHGTAMASLVLHGELDASDDPLPSRIYCRPVMHPSATPGPDGLRHEIFPPNRLPVDLIHRAVRRMLEGDAGAGPVAPNVRIVNLSLGDAHQPFDRELSPWARLLDWLAWKYNVLFIVAAGNHAYELHVPRQFSAIEKLSDTDLQTLVARAMAAQRGNRRLLAPAEAVNGLTVGALHSQRAAVPATSAFVDLFRGGELPSPLSSVATGYRKAIKPEILVPGGLYHFSSAFNVENGGCSFRGSLVRNQPGQLVAAPGGTAVPPNSSTRTTGTSNAAALTTRKAVQLLELLGELQGEPGGNALASRNLTVALKAMLVHGASWQDWEGFFDQAFDGPDEGMVRWWRIKKICTAFLGYGPADFERSTLCSDQRIVVLGVGELAPDEAHIFAFPLPPSLSAKRVGRRLTTTLAWLTPTNPRHRNYTIADLWLDPPIDNLRVNRRDVVDKSARIGTIQHEVFEGEGAIPIAEGDFIPLQVNCRLEINSAKLERKVPYALLASLEIAKPIGVDLYQEVKVALNRLRVKVPIGATVST